MILMSDVCPVGGEARLFLDVVPESLPGIQDMGSSGLEGVWNDTDDATQNRPGGC